jgi:hypothetical protein
MEAEIDVHVAFACMMRNRYEILFESLKGRAILEYLGILSRG